MINIFQDSYENRLKNWHDLRKRTRQSAIDRACVEIDNWWQQAPLIKNYLHWNDTENWLDPWSILSENVYCPLVRAMGIVYTLLMNEINDVELVIATDLQCEEHYLVMVNNKYVLNYWPATVIDNNITDFTIIRRISTIPLRAKIS
jgi:hypothetical protein